MTPWHGKKRWLGLELTSTWVGLDGRGQSRSIELNCECRDRAFCLVTASATEDARRSDIRSIGAIFHSRGGHVLVVYLVRQSLFCVDRKVDRVSAPCAVDTERGSQSRILPLTSLLTDR